MIPSPRPRSTRQALTGLHYALSGTARPNPLVFAWRWRYELVIGIGLPVGLIALFGIPVTVAMLCAMALLGGMAMAWTPARRHLIAWAWCVITPHRVRSGCVQAWIHSRRGKIPIVLFITRQPFGEWVHLWCRAGTSAIDFMSARRLLTAACWACDVRVNRNPRFAQLIALDIIRRVPPARPSEPELGRRVSNAQRPRGLLRTTTASDRSVSRAMGCLAAKMPGHHLGPSQQPDPMIRRSA